MAFTLTPVELEKIIASVCAKTIASAHGHHEMEVDDAGRLQIVQNKWGLKTRRTLSHILEFGETPESTIPYLVDQLGYDLEGKTVRIEEGVTTQMSSDLYCLLRWTIEGNNIPLLKWLIKKGCPVPDNAVWLACSADAMDMLDFLVRNFPTNSVPDTRTISEYSTQVQEWLCAHKS